MAMLKHMQKNAAKKVVKRKKFPKRYSIKKGNVIEPEIKPITSQF